MKWRGRRQSKNVEVEPPLDPMKWSALNKAGWAREKKPALPKGKTTDMPEGSELRKIGEAGAGFIDKAGERARREGWMDAKYSKHDDNWTHMNFRKGGKVKAQRRDYGK